LGVGAALTTDLVNQGKNKYRNNQPFELQVILNDNSFDNYETEVLISAAAFNKFYSEDIKKDIRLPATISRKTDSSGFLKISTNDNTPSTWMEMAAASGDEKVLLAEVHLFKKITGKVYSAKVIFESVSFLKMKSVTDASLSYAGTAVTIALGLIGIMALWLGVMKVAEDAGLIRIIARALKPLTKRLFPEIPTDHPAMSAMIMNISANMLGLGNAATPFGLKAMEEMDKLNPNKGTATNAMVTFLAINTAGLTLIPATAIAVRAAAGSTNPAIIIGTSIFGALCATIAGITSAKIIEKFYLDSWKFTDWLKKNSKIILSFISVLVLFVIIFVTGFHYKIASIFSFITVSGFRSFIEVVSALAIPLLIVIFIGYGAIKKIKVYEQFVEGAKEGFNIAVKIIPYLVAMLVAIGIFRAGGAMDWLIYALSPVTNLIGMPADALPMALMRPLSGSGSLGIMAENLSVYGPDSFIGILVSTFYGSTETTFYVLAVYFGAVNIKNIRHALPVGLIADVAGILGALFIVKLLFS
jgi:spore maturation protein SpmA